MPIRSVSEEIKCSVVALATNESAAGISMSPQKAWRMEEPAKEREVGGKGLEPLTPSV